MTASSRTSTPRTVCIDAFSVYGGDQPVHYSSDHELIPTPRTEDHAAVFVRLDVDGDHTAVEVDLRQSDPLTVLERTIEALQTVLDQHQRMVGADRHQFGRCMARGDWGRCQLTELHEEDHDFPTEEDWDRLNLVRPKSA